MLRCAVLILAAGLASARLADMPLPQWGTPNMVEGVIHLPRSAAKESFQAWFDGENSRSRIDYNGGIVKTYQLPKENTPDKHIFYKDYPTGSEKRECMCVDTDGLPQSGLPDPTGFTLAGMEVHFGGKASKWQREEVSENFRFVFTLWVKYDEQGTTAHAIPLKYETLMIDTAMGTQIDHFHIEYTNYVVGAIDPDTFIPKGECPNNIGDLNMNPMEEFVGPSKHAEEEFERFKGKHDRRYETDQEHAKRLSIFRHNLRYIESHNRAGHSFTLAVNHFADRTPEELAAMRGLPQADLSECEASPFPYSDAEVEELSKEMPQDVDLRLIGAVSPVRDQGSCRSYWAFVAVGTVEGALFRHNKRLVKLSEQALMDCSWNSKSTFGCNGGVTCSALDWIKKNSLPTDEEYGGYLEQYGVCHLKNMTKTYSVDAVVRVPGNEEGKLKLAIFRHGPVTVLVNAVSKSFPFYSHGIYNEDCDSQVANLWILAVGFGVQDGQKYWLLKNAWGPNWGSDGYMLMSAEGNVCSVESAPFYVEIAR